MSLDMDLSEVDVHALLGAVSFKLKETRWDVSDDAQWSELLRLKKLEALLVEHVAPKRQGKLARANHTDGYAAMRDRDGG